MNDCAKSNKKSYRKYAPIEYTITSNGMDAGYIYPYGMWIPSYEISQCKEMGEVIEQRYSNELILLL